MRSSTIVVVALVFVAIISQHSSVATPTKPPVCSDATCCGQTSCIPCRYGSATQYCRGLVFYVFRLFDDAASCSGYSGSPYDGYGCTVPADKCPCVNGGTCDGPYNSCQCKGGWMGDTCSECLCQNSGTCNGPDGACQSPPPAPPPPPPSSCSAATCCSTSSCIQCDNNGTTVSCFGTDYFGGYSYAIYSNPNCQSANRFSQCPSDVCLCQNGGTCDGPGGTCQCKGGWTGERCTIQPPCSAALCCGTDICVSCDNSNTYCRGINDKDIGNDPSTRSRFGLAGLGVHDRYFGVFNCPYACSFGGDGLRGGRSLNASVC
ncbi:unnamed protein product [Adineta steineri]|uniref:EGF-like domain-containing protein n=1 Tax=Adineta steineri TaxID=433720 RepID=A0A819GT76_9BILA|nr:unnamed protein product [Adineta steineri]CAF3886847.1 unnamed protein product [Adineta steineri]